MNEERDSPSGLSARSRFVSKFLPFAIGAAVVLAMITTVLVAGFLWRMRHRPVATSAGVPKANPNLANWSPATFSARVEEAVRKTSDKSWSIKGGRAFMQVRRKADDSLELRFVYPFDGFLPRETIALVKIRWGSAEVAKLAGELNITPEQLNTLKAVSPATDMPVSGADRERLRGLFEDYLATGGKGAASEKALVEAVADLDSRYYDRTRERIDNIAQKVKALFNEEELAALSERFGPTR